MAMRDDGDTHNEHRRNDVDRSYVYRFKAIHLIYYILGVIEALLALRFIFHLFGANALAPIVSFTYAVSDFLMIPFETIFPTFSRGIAVIEWPVLVAMIIYGLIFWGIAKLINLLTAKSPGDEI